MIDSVVLLSQQFLHFLVQVILRHQLVHIELGATAHACPLLLRPGMSLAWLWFLVGLHLDIEFGNASEKGGDILIGPAQFVLILAVFCFEMAELSIRLQF